VQADYARQPKQLKITVRRLAREVAIWERQRMREP
jgi:hypothetical protein